MTIKGMEYFWKGLGVAVICIAFLYGCGACVKGLTENDKLVIIEKEKTKQLEIQLEILIKTNK